MDKCELKKLLLQVLNNTNCKLNVPGTNCKLNVTGTNCELNVPGTNCELNVPWTNCELTLQQMNDYIRVNGLVECNLATGDCDNCDCDNCDNFNTCNSSCNNNLTYKKKNKEYIKKKINNEIGLDFYGRLNRLRKNINIEIECNKNTFFADKTDTRIISLLKCCKVNNCTCDECE
jgi:hypothetical protein